jgi:hypothetical protein
MRLEEHRSIRQKKGNKKKSTRENLKLNTLEGKLITEQDYVGIF